MNESSWGINAGRDKKQLCLMKRNCNVLFQQLIIVSSFFSTKVRKKAKTLSVEWKRSLLIDNVNAFGAMAFLQFFWAIYSLLSEFPLNEFAISFVMDVANDNLPKQYQIVGLTNKVSGLVQKLIDKGK
ncbi:hypothetical protein VNO77_44799 [Canavalia gladiata]|uniref:FRIGIDA-like protein n=1 Tax=Canavalia gladiata TaxID=3824 RepID=A0AAN9JYP1_CANGL